MDSVDVSTALARPKREKTRLGLSFTFIKTCLRSARVWVQTGL
jgi:hypothetical protein